MTGTSIDSGSHAHDAKLVQPQKFIENVFENFLHWSCGGRFACAVELDETHTMIILGAMFCNCLFTIPNSK